jgi:hypothetical protein
MPNSYDETATSSTASFPRWIAPATSSLPRHSLAKTAHNYQEFRSKPALEFRVPPCICRYGVWLLRISGDFSLRPATRFSPLENGAGTARKHTTCTEKGRDSSHSRAKQLFFGGGGERRERGRKGREGKCLSGTDIFGLFAICNRVLGSAIP